MWNRPPAANLSRRIASFARVDARTVMIVALLFLGSNVLVESVARVTIDLNSGQKASLSGSCIWDCGWYASIVTGGYDVGPHDDAGSHVANWAFFPAFPLVASGLKLLLHVSLQSALVITSKVFLAGTSPDIRVLNIALQSLSVHSQPCSGLRDLIHGPASPAEKIHQSGRH